MATLLQDLRYGARMLARQPGMTAVAVLTLALGICANSTIFSWIRATILDPIPGASRTSELVTIMRGDWNESPTPPFSYADYLDHRARNRAFSGVMAYHDDWMALTGGEKPERVYGQLVSGNYFSVLGVRPALGRLFGPADEGAVGSAPAAVISDALWHARFGASPGIVGRSIQINRQQFTIVGVTPRGFYGAKTGMRVDLWIPLVMDPLVIGSRRIDDRDAPWLQLMGRLAPGVSLEQASASTAVVMQQIVRAYPDDHRGANQITLDPMWRSPFGANVYLYATLPLLLGIAGVVLVLACANVANLMLVRSVARRREMAIRLAIGAGRWRVVRQVLIESLLVALAGGAVAVLFTAWTAESFGAFMPPTSNPIVINGRLDALVVMATLLVGVGSSLVSGILPAWRTSRLAPVEVLNDETGRVSGGLHRARLSKALVVAQVALSLLLLVCAGLFVRSLQKSQQADKGFDPSRVLLASFDLHPSGYAEADGLAFDRRVVDRLAALPGVESVALADWVPLTFSKHTRTVEPEGYVPREHESMEMRRAIVSPGYFRTLRIPLTAGRDFAPEDSATTQKVTVVSHALAARYWPGQDPIGKRVRAEGEWFTVIGVARDSKHHRLGETPEPMAYFSAFQLYTESLIVHVRATGRPETLAAPVRSAIHALDPNLPVFDVLTLEKAVSLASIFERLAATFVGGFGLLALALAAVGIYGVLSYTTRQRTREIGVRMALGAGRGTTFRMIVGQGLVLAAAGLSLGLALCWGTARYLRGVLFGVAETDPLTYLAVVLLLGGVAVAACAIPAWRASRMEPLAALRSE